MSIDQLKTRLASKLKGTHVSIMSDSDVAQIKSWVTTNVYDLNRILSGTLFKSVPEKSYTLIVGPEHSFKSSKMALFGGYAQKQGYIPVIIDTEGGMTTEFVSRWGMDPDNIIYTYTPWIDQIKVFLSNIIDTHREAIKAKEVPPKYCILLDSIGGIEKQKIIDDALDGTPKADQGTLQKELKPMYKMLVNICKNQNSIAFASGHLYGNPSGYGDAEQIGGGKYAKLAPDIIISLKKSKIYDGTHKDKKVIGNQIKAITMKNRFYPPFSEATIDINFKSGLNEKAGLLDIAIDAGIITQGGAWYTNNKTGEKVQGGDNALDLIDDATIKELNDFISQTGYSTLREDIKEEYVEEKEDE